MSKKIPHHSSLSNEESAQNGFLYIPSDLFNDFSLSLEEERILAIVRSYGGSCYWTEERFANFCRCSTRTIIRAIRRLEEIGRLRKETRGNQSNLYHEIPVEGQSSIVTNCHYHSDKMSVPYCQNVTSIVTNCHYDSDKMSPYIDIDNTNNKDIDILEPVADAPTIPTLAESATPSPSSKPEPKTKSKKKSFPDEAYWTEAFPSILDWMKAKGFNGSEAAAKTWFDQCVERMRDACEANPSKYRYDNWAAAFKNWNRDRLPKVRESGLTDKELNHLFDFVWSDIRADPIIPEDPVKDEEEVKLIEDVLVSMFGLDFVGTMKKKAADEKRFYKEPFKEKYEQAIKNKRR